ncbi:MAG: hypothetical protein IPH83_13370 [Gammaproteobacteria bacterium]|nr:hypothetical protein [Gammaproteobacteria bacterium]
MNSRLRHTATLIALCAMLLRGAIPLGWMPGSQGELMALCTVNGLIEVRLGDDTGLLDEAPSTQAESSAHKICSFAAVTPLGSAHATFLPTMAIAGSAILLPAPSPFTPEPRFDDANPARAPPIC